jgi:hypothetical protein
LQVADNLDFVRALGMIRGLKKLVISGYYAKNWPAYLEERMGVRVRAICGHCREERELKEGDLNDEELKIEKLIRETNEKELQTFMEYQQGTEVMMLSLFPAQPPPHTNLYAKPVDDENHDISARQKIPVAT